MASSNLRAETAAEWRAQLVKPAPQPKGAPLKALDPIEEAARRRCAIASLCGIARSCLSEARALRAGDDRLAVAYREVTRLLARDLKAATRPIFERASRPPETTETRANLADEKGRAA